MKWRLYVSCDVLPSRSAFSYAFFAVLDHIPDRIFQYGRIDLAYLFPYRSPMAEKLEGRSALNPVSFCTPRVCCYIYSAENCRRAIFLSIFFKIRFHSFAIWADRAVKHHDDRLFGILNLLVPGHILKFNNTASVQSTSPLKL